MRIPGSRLHRDFARFAKSQAGTRVEAELNDFNGYPRLWWTPRLVPVLHVTTFWGLSRFIAQSSSNLR